jgi:outer membrane protein TolC
MRLSRPRRLPVLRRLPWLAASLPLFALGCAQQTIALFPSAPAAVARAAAPEPVEKSATPADAHPANALPIGLDTVLRLACDQNTQIALAREKLHEACAEKDVADLGWLPDVYLGLSYWNHQGGIQNEDGTLTHSSTQATFGGTEIKAQLDLKEIAYQRVNACRQVMQRKGELSRITSETLLEASTTYIDLLMARTSEAIALQLEKHEKALLDRVQDLAKDEPPARIHAAAIEADSLGHHQAIVKLRRQGDAAAVKLANLLGLDPSMKLMPVDDRLAPFALADTNAPAEDLVNRALSNGPGVRDLENLLALVQSSLDKAKGPSMLLPIFELCANEGVFGAAAGDDTRWDNRFDLGFHMRWNLTDAFRAREKQRVAESKLQQLYLSHQELRNKLSAGVHEARSAITYGEDEIRFGADQIRSASKAYTLSDERMKNPPPERVDRTNEVQVLQALRGLELAHLHYLEAVSAYDKAQLRLLVLTGATTCDTPPPRLQPSSLPAAAAPPQVQPAPKEKNSS